MKEGGQKEMKKGVRVCMCVCGGWRRKCGGNEDRYVFVECSR